MAEGHGDSAPQGALKVALSGTLDRAGVLVGGSVALRVSGSAVSCGRHLSRSAGVPQFLQHQLLQLGVHIEPALGTGIASLPVTAG